MIRPMLTLFLACLAWVATPSESFAFGGKKRTGVASSCECTTPVCGHGHSGCDTQGGCGTMTCWRLEHRTREVPYTWQKPVHKEVPYTYTVKVPYVVQEPRTVQECRWVWVDVPYSCVVNKTVCVEVKKTVNVCRHVWVDEPYEYTVNVPYTVQEPKTISECHYVWVDEPYTYMECVPHTVMKPQTRCWSTSVHVGGCNTSCDPCGSGRKGFRGCRGGATCSTAGSSCCAEWHCDTVQVPCTTWTNEPRQGVRKVCKCVCEPKTIMVNVTKWKAEPRKGVRKICKCVCEPQEVITHEYKCVPTVIEGTKKVCKCVCEPKQIMVPVTHWKDEPRTGIRIDTTFEPVNGVRTECYCVWVPYPCPDCGGCNGSHNHCGRCR